MKQQTLIDWLNAIWDSDLPSNSKLIASYLRCRMRPDQLKAWPSIKTIKVATSLSGGTVRRHIKILTDKGWLDMKKGEGASNTYYLVERTSPQNSSVVESNLSDDATHSSEDKSVPEAIQSETAIPTSVMVGGTATDQGGTATDPEYITNKPINKKTKKSRFTPIPESLVLKDQWAMEAVDYWTSKVVRLDVTVEFEKFHAHYLSSGKKSASWKAEWKKWYIRSAEYQQNKPSVPKVDAYSNLTDRSWADGIETIN